MKYKIIGLSVIALMLLAMYLLIIPREDDIIPYQYTVDTIDHLEIKKMEDTLPTKITDTTQIKPIIQQLLKCKKAKIANAKGGYTWIDLTVFFKGEGSKFFRIYDNKYEGNYIVGQNYRYRNDSLKIVIDELLKKL